LWDRHADQQTNGEWFPITLKVSHSPGDFPNAEAIHHNTLKLPVWHREEYMPLVDSYIEAFRKVTDNYRDLLG
jgi:perosamine synthetase